MLDPEAPDERRDEIAVNARRRIEAGATLKQERSWGTRKMSYEIKQRNEADYRFYRFEEGKGVLDDLNHNLKITDGVLRFRIYKVDPRAPVIDPPPPLTFAAGSERPGGRSRRDEGHENRPPRAPDSAESSPAGRGSGRRSAPAERLRPPKHRRPRRLPPPKPRRPTRLPLRRNPQPTLQPRRQRRPPRLPSRRPRLPRPIRPSPSSRPSKSHPAISAFFSSEGARTRRPRP